MTDDYVDAYWRNVMALTHIRLTGKIERIIMFDVVTDEELELASLEAQWERST